MQSAERHVRAWLQQVIISLNFCPFAKKEFIRERIAYVVTPATTQTDALSALLEALAHLEQQPEIETTLLIFERGFTEFAHYWELIESANVLLNQSGYEGIYQLASFHPHYLFTGEAAEDASHYTNRAPYPIVHILRESSLESVLAHYPNPEQIPQNNIDTARELGVTKLQKILANCKP